MRMLGLGQEISLLRLHEQETGHFNHIHTWSIINVHSCELVLLYVLSIIWRSPESFSTSLQCCVYKHCAMYVYVHEHVDKHVHEHV